MNRTPGWILALLLMMLSSILVTPASGQTPTEDANRWAFTVAPYLIFPHMDGQAAVRGILVDVDVGPSEVFEQLDFGAMVYMEMANRDWSISLDGLYMNLGETGLTPITERDAEVDMKQLALQVTGMRRVASWAEVGVGGRLNSLEGGLFVAPGDVILPGVDVSQTKTWFDPLIAARFTAPIESRWHLGIRGDVGGFGVGSDFAWQVFPFVGYRFSRLFELGLGYRAMGMKYETGSGDDYFLYDMVIFGPQIGLGFHF
jgi:hypothetical protein